MPSKTMGYLLALRMAPMTASYPSTSPLSSSTPREGSSLPSVWLTSKTVPIRKPTSLFSEAFSLPCSASSLGASPAGLALTTTGQRILMPCSPLRTCLPNLSCQARYPATRVASGFCIAMSRKLLTL